MKKIVAIIVTLMMILAMSCAFAFDWSNVTVQSSGCDKYNVVLYKLERVEGINDDFFRIATNSTAKIGDTVYFGGYAVGENSVQAFANAFLMEDYKLIDLARITEVTTTQFEEDVVGGITTPIFSAKVIGNDPTVKVVLKSGNDVTECTYKGQQIVASADATQVKLGDFTFVRNLANGMVSEVYYDQNKLDKALMTAADYEKAIAALSVLNITITDVENLTICMSNDNIIKNFGNYCETTKSICWGAKCKVEIATMEIPKTGDMPLWVEILNFLGIEL